MATNFLTLGHPNDHPDTNILHFDFNPILTNLVKEVAAFQNT
jgi:hypothetical protein